MRHSSGARSSLSIYGILVRFSAENMTSSIWPVIGTGMPKFSSLAVPLYFNNYTTRRVCVLAPAAEEHVENTATASANPSHDGAGLKTAASSRTLQHQFVGTRCKDCQKVKDKNAVDKRDLKVQGNGRLGRGGGFSRFWVGKCGKARLLQSVLVSLHEPAGANHAWPRLLSQGSPLERATLNPTGVFRCSHGSEFRETRS